MDVAVVEYEAKDAPSAFARSMHLTGFAVLVAHPLDPALIAAIRDEWLEFFAGSAKNAYARGESEQRGYFPPPPRGEELPNGLVRDHKEFFHLYASDRHPVEVSDAACRYFEQATRLAATLLSWLDRESPSEVTAQLSRPLAEMIEGSRGTVLRLQHYLPLEEGEAAGPLRALAHEDINLITLLPAPSEPGLQVCDVEGIWHELPYDPRSMIVNGGEMLQLAMRHYYPATPHRVVNPTGTEPRGSRFSLPLFVHPAEDVELVPGRTASSFLQERIEALRQKGWAVAPGGRKVRA